MYIRYVTDKYHKKEAFPIPLAKCIRRYVYNGPNDHFGLGLVQIDPRFTKTCEIDFDIFFPSDIDL